MSSNLEIEVVEEVGGLIYFFNGQIDEDSDFSAVNIGNHKSVIFDLENVNLINSCGIRDWVKFQSELPEDLIIVYRKCPQVIVEQFNIIKGFIKTSGIVESFYAPYYNDIKDEEVKVLIRPSEVIDLKAPEKKDDEGNLLEFDEIELQYFNFLKSK